MDDCLNFVEENKNGLTLLCTY